MTEEQIKAITKHMTELYARLEESAPKESYHFSQHVFCGWCLEQLYYQKDTACYHCINCSDVLLIEQ
jgi:NADH pyrophosphatase NudC (nudix superfamily)